MHTFIFSVTEFRFFSDILWNMSSTKINSTKNVVIVIHMSITKVYFRFYHRYNYTLYILRKICKYNRLMQFISFMLQVVYIYFRQHNENPKQIGVCFFCKKKILKFCVIYWYRDLWNNNTFWKYKKNLDITPTSTAVSVILTYVIYLISAVHRNA